jgi:hypothetical protein
LLRTRQEIVETFQGIETALNFLGPGKRAGVVPGFLSLSHRERPIEQIANMGDDFRRSATVLAGVEIGVGRRRIAESLVGAIGDGSYRVTKEVACGSGVWNLHSGFTLAGSKAGEKGFVRALGPCGLNVRRDRFGQGLAEQ